MRIVSLIELFFEAGFHSWTFQRINVKKKICGKALFKMSHFFGCNVGERIKKKRWTKQENRLITLILRNSFFYKLHNISSFPRTGSIFFQVHFILLFQVRRTKPLVLWPLVLQIWTLWLLRWVSYVMLMVGAGSHVLFSPEWFEDVIIFLYPYSEVLLNRILFPDILYPDFYL